MKTYKIILIVLFVLAVVFGAYFGLAWVIRRANSGTTTPTDTSSTGNTTGGKTNLSDSSLVGTWTSECLVPDTKSPWSEKHQFVIKSDGTAVHTRWSNDTMSQDCSPTDTKTNNFKLTIPKAEQINITDASTSETMYDIYQVAGNTLMFGHGFRGDDSNLQVKDSKFGTSPETRFTSLNQFIVYKK